MAVVANGAYTRTNSYGPGEARAYPRFYIEPIEDPVASAQAGRLICRDEERVEILLPGNPLTKPVHVVTDIHRQRWPEEYKAFKAGQELSLEGTPLEQWPILRRSQVMELKAINFMTVEQVARADDLAIQRMGLGGRRLRELAIAYLDDAASASLATALTAENDKKEAENASLRRQVAEMGELLRTIHADHMAAKNAPSFVESTIPGLMDPIAAAAQQRPADAPSASSLDSLPTPKRRGRPPGKTEAA